MNWLADNKKSAICISIDDIRPQKSCGYHECGGNLDNGSLGKIKWLMQRHPQIRVSLCTTPDWREIKSRPTRKVLAKIPFLRDRFYLSKILKKGTMQLDKHPEFVEYLINNPKFEIIPHGLYHCHKGLNIPVEFQNETTEQFSQTLKQVIEIFDKSGLNYVRGFAPPAWNAPQPLLDALTENDFEFIISARDIVTPITPDAKTNMSGMKNVSLISPTYINPKLIHFPCNFQATSRIERAFEILDHGGLLSIKAHISEGAALDAVCDLYMNYLDLLFSKIEDRYGEDIWWTSVGEISNHIKQSNYGN